MAYGCQDDVDNQSDAPETGPCKCHSPRAASYILTHHFFCRCIRLAAENRKSYYDILPEICDARAQFEIDFRIDDDNSAKSLGEEVVDMFTRRDSLDGRETVNDGYAFIVDAKRGSESVGRLFLFESGGRFVGVYLPHDFSEF